MTAAPLRLALVAHRDPRGEVGERVDLLVAGLRTIVDRVVLVADALSAAGRERADALADRVVVAPARSTIALLAAGLASVDDEVRAAASVLVTDTERYGPLPDRDLAAIVAEQAPVDGAWTWVPTAPRQRLEPSPWLWAHREVVGGEAWRGWWRAARDDGDERGLHDLVLALRAAGIDVPSVRRHRDARIQRASLELPLEQPFFERLLFTADPVELEEHALGDVLAWRALQHSGFPMACVARDLRRTAPPRQIATNIRAMRVLERWPEELHGAPHPRLAVVTHVYYPDALAELGTALQHMPVGWTWIVTTGSEESKATIERSFAVEVSGWLQRLERFEVRVVDSNRGRDVSAFLIGCADVLRPDEHGAYAFDVVLKLHSKRSPQDPYPRATRFQRHVLGSVTGATHALLQLFLDEPELGMAMPPQIHVGYPTLGRAWFGNRPLAEQLASRLGIDVPFDDGSPLAPFGSMFAARPEALRPLVDAFGWHDFPDEAGYRDGGVAHAVERLFAYAAISEGYTVRTVTTPEIAAESHQLLEWKLQEILQDVPGTARQQVQLATTATRALATPAGAVVRTARVAAAGASRLRGSAVRGARGALGRLRRRGE